MSDNRPPSFYVPLDVNFYDDPKLLGVSVAAEVLFLRSLAYAKRVRTGGKLDEHALNQISVKLDDVPELAAELVAVKLWTKQRKTGFLIHNWQRWNGADKKRSASQLANHSRWHVNRNRPSPSCPLCRSQADSVGIPSGVLTELQRKESTSYLRRIGGLRPQPLSPTMFDRPPEWVPETREEGLR